jgi:DNA replication and repair protein RecF
VELKGLRPFQFRNLTENELTWSGEVNWVLGGNGQGKTSLLEAITVLGNLRSFRTTSHRALTLTGTLSYRLEGHVAGRFGLRRLAVEVSPGPPLERVLSLDGRPADMADYLTVFPVFALSAADRQLVGGPPQTRRSFLDRFAFLVEPSTLPILRDYRRCLQQRNAGLQRRLANDQLAAWDERLATSAAAVVERRLAALARLRGRFSEVHHALCGDDSPTLELGYRGESSLEGENTLEGLASQYRKRYHETRERDREAGYTASGPHRHDLTLRVDGVLAREILSAGQVKVAAAALRLAALREVEVARGEHLPLVVDDVDAELDRGAVERLLSLVHEGRQLFLSSAHAQFVNPIIGTASRFHVVAGTCTIAGGDRENP